MARRAFTNVELMLVVAILTVVAGLLLPAVQKVREAAARARCMENLHRLGTAFRGHLDARGAYPHGGTNRRGRSEADPDSRGEWAWSYHVLPWLEQEALHKEPSHRAIDAAPLPAFHCPARRSPGLFGERAQSDYAGCAGSDPAKGSNGILVRADRPKVRRTEVANGVSHTVLVAERRLNAARFGQADDDRRGWARPGWDGDFTAYRVGSIAPARDSFARGEDEANPGFGSAHPVVFNALFADGSVRPIRYGVDATAWLRACVRDDGMDFSLD